MLEIDGSRGEGGGQIVRSALALSAATGIPFRMYQIRAGRRRPGLLRQHLTALRAAAAVCGADVRGAATGSREITFVPGPVRPADLRFAVGSAGSACLVLQTVLPPLLRADVPSRLVLEGGTHNPWAPPFDFLAATFLPQLAKMGARVGVELERPGFYPAGGGRFTVSVEPAARLAPLRLLERGEDLDRRAVAVVAHLSAEIAKRELEVVGRKLGWPRREVRATPESVGPGNAVMLFARFAEVTEVVTGFGEKRVRAEKVAETAVEEMRDYLATDAPVGRHLADQLLIPLALAGAGEFRTVAPTRHLTTNVEIVETFLDVRFEVEREEAGTWRVAVA